MRITIWQIWPQMVLTKNPREFRHGTWKSGILENAKSNRIWCKFIRSHERWCWKCWQRWISVRRILLGLDSDCARAPTRRLIRASKLFSIPLTEMHEMCTHCEMNSMNPLNILEKIFAIKHDIICKWIIFTQILFIYIEKFIFLYHAKYFRGFSTKNSKLVMVKILRN